MEELRKCKERMSNRIEAENIIRTQVRGIEILMKDSMQDVSVPVEVIGLLGQVRSILDKTDINSMPVSEDHQYRASQVYSGHRGRPLYDIKKEQLQFFIENYFTSGDMASLLGVSRRTVERRLANFRLTHGIRFSDISDNELISIVHSIINNFPRSGLKTIEGHLISQGIHVQRERIRRAVRTVDPVGQQLRQFRVYTAKGLFSSVPSCLVAYGWLSQTDTDALPEYGMDPDAPLPEPSDEDNIYVPSIELLNEEQLHSFNAKMRGIHVADLSGIEPYLHALDFVDEILEV